MILSNRKLRLIIIALLLLIFSFFLGLIQPKALTNSARFGDVRITIPQGINYGNYVLNNSWYNFGEGEIHFSIAYDFPSSLPTSNNPLAEVHLITASNVRYKCDIGTLVTYNDSLTQYVNYQVVCPIDFSGTSLRQIMLITRSSDTGQANTYKISEYATYVSKDDSNYSSSITNIQNNTNNINNSINDSNVDSASSSASDWNSKNATNGTITNLLTLPITLLQAIVSGLQTSCSSFSLGSLFGTNITLPCINVGNLIGSGLWTTIDILFSGFMILAIAKKLIKIFNDFTNLKSNQMDELYGGGSK